MDKEKLQSILDSSIEKLDQSITPEYFLKQLKLYSKTGDDLEFSQSVLAYAIFRESARLNANFISSVILSLSEDLGDGK